MPDPAYSSIFRGLQVGSMRKFIAITCKESKLSRFIAMKNDLNHFGLMSRILPFSQGMRDRDPEISIPGRQNVLSGRDYKMTQDRNGCFFLCLFFPLFGSHY